MLQIRLVAPPSCQHLELFWRREISELGQLGFILSLQTLPCIILLHTLVYFAHPITYRFILKLVLINRIENTHIWKNTPSASSPFSWDPYCALQYLLWQSAESNDMWLDSLSLLLCPSIFHSAPDKQKTDTHSLCCLSVTKHHIIYHFRIVAVVRAVLRFIHVVDSPVWCKPGLLTLWYL